MGLLMSLLKGVISLFEFIRNLIVFSTAFMWYKAIEHIWKNLRYRHDENENKKTSYFLVLDLENTLIRTAPVEDSVPSSKEQASASSSRVAITRPHLETFLDEMSKYYEIVLYCTSHMEDADALLESAKIGHHFARRLYRNSCIIGSGGTLIKDLGMISSDMSKVVLIDNSANAGVLYRENFVPIDIWLGGKYDKALLDIMPFLQALCHVADVHNILNLRWNATGPFPAMNSSRRGNDDEHAESAPNAYIDIQTNDLPLFDAEWDEFGQRLSSKVKHIFGKLGPKEGFHSLGATAG